MKRPLLTVLATLMCFSAFLQVPPPSVTYPGRMLIRYAHAHIGDGTDIPNSYIEVQNGEISRVANANTTRIDETKYDTIIDAAGAHVYPGFMIMDSRIGLTEIDAVNATHDFRETGAFLPNIKALSAFNSESKIIPTIRTNGVLLAQIAPAGNVISGTAGIARLDGWNWQDATIKREEGVLLNWPQRYVKTGWWAEPGGVKQNKKYATQLIEIDAFISASIAYNNMYVHTPENLRLKAMSGVISGEQRLYIRVNWARDILDVIQFVRRHKLSNVAIIGGAEAHLVTTELRENNIPVIIDRVHKLPVHEDDPIDAPFTLAKRLSDAGIQVAFATSGDMEVMISRNLPFQVGTAVHYGLDYEAAIRSITLLPAELTGIADRYGSLAPGKSATLFISQGDALDITTNNVTLALIDGRILDLSNHQQELQLKYSRRNAIKSGQE